MQRLAFTAALLSGVGAVVLSAGPAVAQTVCCVDPGMRGYQQPVYAQPAYAPPAYGAPQYAAPPPPEPQGSGLRGYVGVEYSKSRLDPATPSPRTEAWTAEGYVATAYRGLDIQGDVKVTRFEDDAGDGWVTSPTLHVYRRSPYGVLGGFVGVSHSGGATLYGGGIEGQANLSAATLYGTIGYGKVDDTVDSNLFAARLEGRYFVTENFRLNASIGYLRQSANGASSKAVVSGVGAEYQLGAIPASINVGYQHANASGSNVEGNTIRVGLRWALNGQTLAARDRVGPSLANFSDIFMGN